MPILGGSTLRKHIILGAFVALGLLSVAACGGGGGNNNAIITYPTPGNLGAATVTASGATITLGATAGLAVGTVEVSGTGSVSASQSATQPGSVPALQSVVRSSSSTVAATSKRAASSGNTAVAYVTVRAAAASSLAQVLLSVSPTGSIPTGTYYLAFWNGSQWVTIGSPATISGGLITLNTGSLSPAVSLASGSSYYLAVYTGQIFTTPTPEPAKPVAVPTSLTLSESTQNTISITTNPGLAITASGYDATLITVAPSPSATADASGKASFTVTANASKTGTTTITFTDPVNQSTQVEVTVNDTYNTPAPSLSAPTLGLSSVASVTVSANASEQLTISSNSSAATLSASSSGSGASSSLTLTTNGTGGATFYVVGAAAGYATISLADTHNNVGTMQVNVSAITNGNVANGTTAWVPCSYARTALTGPVNAASPAPNTPEPAQTAPAETPNPLSMPSPNPTSTAGPLSLAALVLATIPPNNDNPGWSGYSTTGVTVGGGAVTYSQSNGTSTITTTITTGTGVAPPAVVGTRVLFLGSVNGTYYPKGTFGACQSFTVPTPPPGVTGGPYLSFYVLEGGGEYTFKYADQEAAIFPTPLSGTSPNTAQGTPSYLFAEESCYMHPSDAGAPMGIWGASITSAGIKGCWPSTYGGDPSGYHNWLQGGFWKPMGPYNLSSYEGQQITLFLGNWSNYFEQAAYEAQFMYVGDIQTGWATTFPTTAPLSKGRSLGTVTLKARSSGTIQSTKIRKP